MLVSAAALLPLPAGAGADWALPHRQGRLVVDGDPSDWRGAALGIVVERPEVPGEPRARASVRLAWDRRALWALFEVEDPTLHVAPPEIEGAALFQWDSVELYIGREEQAGARMGSGDFQVLLAADGRYAVLQGDPLLFEIEAMAVPKRVRPELALEVATRRVEGGYVVECAVPFAALGIVADDDGDLRLDLGLNDWIADHPPLEQLPYDLETLERLDQKKGDVDERFNEHGTAGADASAVERALYRPWSWSGTADFGHPATWKRARLAGAPPLAERIVEGLGPQRTLALGALLAAVALVGAGAVSERRHRRRLQGLLERIAALEHRATAAPVSRPEPAPPDPVDWLARILARASDGEAPERFELRAMRAVRERLAEPMSAADLADRMCVSLRTLERHVGEALHCTPRELILAVKMREARQLLEQGAWQVQEVARRVGYDDPAHFSRRFKSYFGAPPAAVVAQTTASAGTSRPVA